MNARAEQDPALRVSRGRAVVEASIGWLLCAWTFLLGCTPLKDADVWWHLGTGREILARGAVPRHDWFIYTDVDRPWVDLHWGFQVLAWLAFRAGGVDLILLLKAAIAASAVGLCWIARRRSASPALAAFLWLVPVTAFAGRLLERPEIFSLLLLATWIFVLARAEKDGRWLFALPLVQLVWTNVHGLFVLGPIVGVAWCVARFVRERAAGSTWLEPLPAGGRALSWPRIAIVAALAGAASLVNPYGARAWMHPFVLFRKFSDEQDFYSVRILEFAQPLHALRNPNYATSYLYAGLALFGLLAATFALLATERRTNVFRLLLSAAFGFLFLEAVRNLTPFALVAGWVITENVAEWLELRRARRARAPAFALPANFAAVGCLAALCVSVVSGVWDRTLGGQWGNVFGLGELRGQFAHEALRFAGRDGMPSIAFVSHIGHASTFIYHHGPTRRVFLNANLEVGTQETFEQYEEILRRMRSREPGWESMIRAGEAEMPVVFLDALHSRREIRGMLETPGWRVVHADGAAAVFVEEAVAARLALPAVDVRSTWWFNARPARARENGEQR